MNIYDFEVETSFGKTVSMKQLQGKTLLIVNIASKCTYTPQLEDLQILYKKYQAQGLVVIGFPCNQFAEQMPGDATEATEFCKLNYGVDFPIFAKVDVNGKNAHPIFQYLSRALPFQGFDDGNPSDRLLKMMISEKQPEYSSGNYIKWNFTKFLIGADGEPIERFESNRYPLDFEERVVEVLG